MPPWLVWAVRIPPAGLCCCRWAPLCALFPGCVCAYRRDAWMLLSIVQSSQVVLLINSCMCVCAVVVVLLQVTTLLNKEGENRQQQPAVSVTPEALKELQEQVTQQGGKVKEAKTVSHSTVCQPPSPCPECGMLLLICCVWVA